jgi:short-subunit dehydrogenase
LRICFRFGGIEFLIGETASLDVGLLINNAGREDSGYFLTIPIDDALDTQTLNCRVPLVLTHHFAKKMKQRSKSGIVFMSSLVAYQGVPFVSNYAGTKAYNLIFAESFAAELKPFNIDVSVTTPGFTDTELAKNWDFSGIPMKPLKAPYVAKKVILGLGKKRVVIPGVINSVLYYLGKYVQSRRLNTFSFTVVFKRVLRKILARPEF